MISVISKTIASVNGVGIICTSSGLAKLARIRGSDNIGAKVV